MSRQYRSVLKITLHLILLLSRKPLLSFTISIKSSMKHGSTFSSFERERERESL